MCWLVGRSGHLGRHWIHISTVWCMRHVSRSRSSKFGEVEADLSFECITTLEHQRKHGHVARQGGGGAVTSHVDPAISVTQTVHRVIIWSVMSIYICPQSWFDNVTSDAIDMRGQIKRADHMGGWASSFTGDAGPSTRSMITLNYKNIWACIDIAWTWL